MFVNLLIKFITKPAGLASWLNPAGMGYLFQTNMTQSKTKND
jgi:hypothetical protein